MRKKTVYLATQNGNGVLKTYLRIEGRKIVGDASGTFLPPQALETYRNRNCWLMANYYDTEAEARDAYIAKAKRDIDRATAALAKVIQ